ncbi:MAG: acetyl-CoA carboxylase biotin carboxyl carrier protein [Kiritimatiellia bacterium]|nr:acetyl-CoA carboxylase biotin carboxyl carrier protein [Lentisphaerota bacterium]
MKLEEIKEIVQLMTDNDLTEFEVEEEGVRMAIKRGYALPPLPPPAPVPVAVAAVAPNVTEEVDDGRYEIVKAPFVGTFYQSSSPETSPFVNIGQEVGPESVLCIVEAMKVMNEIKAEVCGIVREIMVENARPVQYGQPLFKIEKM